MTSRSIANQRPDDRLRLVFGASGYIGGNLVPALVAAGQRVRATARNVEVLEARHWPGVELVAADALNPATLAAALEGVDTAYGFRTLTPPPPK